jgi:NitT/TauT family transport system ATP-binding protein
MATPAQSSGPHDVHAGREAKLRVVGVSKVFQSSRGETVALDDIALDIRAGEIVCIVGPTGCGKTTLLWGMAGLNQLTRGEITLNGEPVNGPRPDEIGMVFQEANLLPWRNLRQNIELPFEIKQTSVDHARIERLLAATALAGFEKAFPRELSGGMRQRAAIVRALAQDPDVLLMDEPFSALDAFTRDESQELLLALWDETGKTIVFVTHNIPEAIFLADRVAVLTPRPGRLARLFEIRLPRPRTADMTFDSEFTALASEIKSSLGGGGGSAR